MWNYFKIKKKIEINLKVICFENPEPLFKKCKREGTEDQEKRFKKNKNMLYIQGRLSFACIW